MKSCALFFRATVAWDVVRDKLSPPGSPHHSFIICRRRSVLIRLGNSLFILISCFQTTYTHLLTFILDLDWNRLDTRAKKSGFPWPRRAVFYLFTLIISLFTFLPIFIGAINDHSPVTNVARVRIPTSTWVGFVLGSLQLLRRVFLLKKKKTTCPNSSCVWKESPILVYPFIARVNVGVPY